MVVNTTNALWGPDAVDTTNIVLPAGSHWYVIGTQDGFSRLFITCQANPVWVAADNLAAP